MADEREETQEELMERVKNMSPEELKEFQKSRCIFCQIISGRIPAKKIYSDDKCEAILDINPAAKGHVLVMPKEHYSVMPQVPKEMIMHLGIVAKKISNVALKSLGAAGTNILVQNGMAAGQKAQHFMLHVIPRYEDDGVPFQLDKKVISDADYTTIMTRLKKRVNTAMGINEPVNEKKVSPVIPQHSAPIKPVQTTIPALDTDTLEKVNAVMKNINTDIQKLEKETHELEEETEEIDEDLGRDEKQKTPLPEQKKEIKPDIDSVKNLLMGK